ncbi:hypothetical protein Zmor_007296 [Zophobas morio]|uniref:Uncharacterized protein n=1 Tax=Zophobas morio TaxID=2755281 RepID=A0AA38IZE9_9CUCU|nr:hypothetical protein Zmor_007296 [Zophobas morio]
MKLFITLTILSLGVIGVLCQGGGHEERREGHYGIGWGGSHFITPVDVHHEEVIHLKAHPEYHYDYRVADHKTKDYKDKHEVRDGYKVHNRLLTIIEDSTVQDNIMSDCSVQTNTNTQENKKDVTDNSTASNTKPKNAPEQPKTNRKKRHIFDVPDRTDIGPNGRKRNLGRPKPNPERQYHQRIRPSYSQNKHFSIQSFVDSEDYRVQADIIMSDSSEQTNTNNQENKEDVTDNGSNTNPEDASEQPALNRKKRHIFDVPVRPNVGLDGEETEEFN